MSDSFLQPPDLQPATPVQPTVVFEDQDIMVVNKPAGLHSVKLSSSDNPSVAKWLAEIRPSMAEIGNNAADAGLVQRLDFETSGLMLAAKSTKIWERLHHSILAGEIQKSYFCAVEGIIEERKISVDSFIGSPYRRSKKMRVYPKDSCSKPPKRALDAKTVFELEKKIDFADITSSPANLGSCLLKVSAATARRHQIRAHAAFIKHPLIGDKLYGATLNLSDYPVAFFLQASSLKFRHPISAEFLSFKIDIPEQIKKMFSVDASQ